MLTVVLTLRRIAASLTTHTPETALATTITVCMQPMTATCTKAAPDRAGRRTPAAAGATPRNRILHLATKRLRVIKAHNVGTTIIPVAGAAAPGVEDSATPAAAAGEITAADLVTEDFTAAGVVAGMVDSTVEEVSGAEARATHD